MNNQYRTGFSKYLLFLVFLISSFTVFAGSMIRLYEPAANLVVDNASIRFRWNNSPFPGQFQVQVSTNIQFTSIIKDTLVSVPGFQSSINVTGTVYWRVRVKGTNYVTNWSPTSEFVAFSPKTLPGLLNWYDGNKVVKNGNKVSSWLDQSAQGNHALQNISSSQPLYIENNPLLNGNNDISLDGNDDYLKFSRQTNIRSVFFIIKHQTGSQPYPGMLGDSVELEFTCWDGSGGFICVNTNVCNGKIFVNKQLRSAGSTQKPKDFTLFSFVTADNVSLDHIASDRYNFGIGRGWYGEYAEILLSSSVLNDSIRNLTEDYLLDKFSPPVLIRDTIINGNFCDPVTINAPAMYKSVEWSNGSTLNPTVFNANGPQSVQALSYFNRSSQNSFLIYPYPRFNNSTVYVCPGDTFKLNMTLPAGFTVLWNTGSTSKNLSIYQTGQYVVRVTDNISCSQYDTINVVVDYPSLSPQPDAFGNLQMCVNEKLFITSPASFDSIRWSTGSSASFITVSTPGAYSVYGRTTAGCILNKNFNLTIAGEAPTANFVTGFLCEDAPSAFTDISTYPAGNNIAQWKWSFGDGNSSTTSAPTNTYNNTGTYLASLKITTNVGCSDSIVKTVTVQRRPQADFYNLLSCAGIPTTFVNNSIANSDSIQGRNWNFGGLGFSTDNNPKFVFPASGDYDIKLLVVNSFGCSDSVTKSTTVNAKPDANFIADDNCEGTNTIFTNLSTVDPPHVITNYFWDYGDETQSIQVSQPHLYATYGEYLVRLAIRSSNQCVDTVIKSIRVFAKPNVDFTISNTQCAGKEIQFTDISSTPDGSPMSNWQWFFAGQGSSTLQNPKFTFNAQGNYTIQLTAKTSIGCSGSKFRSIGVTSPPLVKFSFTPNYGPPPLNVSFTNQSPTNSNYIWDYGDGSPTYNGFASPVHNYTVRGTYPIKLLATDFKGCSDSLVKDILVDNAVVDGVMVTVNVVPNGDYYKVVVTILNNSNIEVTTLGITIRLANGSEVRETWTGSLKPGNTVVYPFSGELRYNAAGDIPVICATIESININALESDLSNNTTCEEITVGPFEVLSVFPNPATDNVNFGVMLPANGEVEITLYDLLGKLQYGMKFSGVTGYNNLRFPVVTLNASVYIAEIKYEGVQIRKKIMRTDK